MTAHELARALLALPDHPVAIESCCGGCYVYPTAAEVHDVGMPGTPEEKVLVTTR